MMIARERLYLTESKDRLVPYGDPKAAFLYAAEGHEIPDSAAERFGLVDGKLKPKGGKQRPAETLLGSSTLAATFEIGGETVQLGTLVAEAHKRSGLDAEAWNALPDADRDARIGEVLGELQAKAAAGTPEKPETEPTKKPEAAPTPKPTKGAKAPAKKAAAKKR